MTTARRTCVIRQSVAGLLVAVLMIGVGVIPPLSAQATPTLTISGDSETAIVTELRAMREEFSAGRAEFRSAMSEGRDFLKVAGGWVGGVATILMVDGSGRARKALARRLSQEPKP